jgi:hypothetical protein
LFRGMDLAEADTFRRSGVLRQAPHNDGNMASTDIETAKTYAWGRDEGDGAFVLEFDVPESDVKEDSMFHGDYRALRDLRPVRWMLHPESRKNRKVASQYAYHRTAVSALSSIRMRGLVPGAYSSFTDVYSEYDDGAHLFFSDTPEAMEGIGSALLRFPWPADAKPDINIYGRLLGHQFATKKAVPSSDIEVESEGSWIPIVNHKTAMPLPGDAYRALVGNFMVAVERYRQAVKKWRADNTEEKHLKLAKSFVLDALQYHGRNLCDALLAGKMIPKGKEKAVEMACRAIHAKSVPKPMAWFEDNVARFEMLAESAAWPDKDTSADSEQAFKAGPFVVHNTIGASPEDVESIRSAVEQAAKDIESVPVPELTKVLYGEVVIVGRITQKNHAAWYDVQKDQVYVRVIPGERLITDLIHELGHRFWKKFAPLKAKSDWATRHMTMSRFPKDVKVVMPKVGDTLSFEITGLKEPPVITKIEASKYYLPNGGFMSFGRLWDALHKDAVIKQFPTVYASTDKEEHFCEALSLRATGRLTGEHLQAFQSMFEGDLAAGKVAARFLREGLAKAGPASQDVMPKGD